MARVGVEHQEDHSVCSRHRGHTLMVSAEGALAQHGGGMRGHGGGFSGHGGFSGGIHAGGLAGGFSHGGFQGVMGHAPFYGGSSVMTSTTELMAATTARLGC
jgi:hypothetical protein